MRDQHAVLDRVPILIGVDLAPGYVNQIWAVDPRVEVLYDPELVGRPRFACDHHGPVERTPEQEERWLEMLGRCEVLLGLGSDHHEGLLDLAPYLKWIQSTSAGVGQRAQRLGLTGSGVTVTTASGIHATALAEFVLMAMLFFIKDGSYLAEEKGRKHWQRYTGGELTGRTLAVVGLGSIGQEVARLGRGFGMETIGTKRNTEGVSPGTAGVGALYRAAELRAMLGKADFVVLCTPHTAETEGLMGEAELQAMKPGAVLINIARGTIVEQEAMVRALQSGHLGGAALDVAMVEPLPASSPLWDMEDVLICPHSGSNVDSENRELTRLFCDNLRLYLAGEPLKNTLDAGLLY